MTRHLDHIAKVEVLPSRGRGMFGRHRPVPRGTGRLVVCSRAEHVPYITTTHRRPHAYQDEAPVGRRHQSLWLQ